MKEVVSYMAADGNLFRTAKACEKHEAALHVDGQADSLLRVVPHITDRMGISRSGWWKGVKDGKFPPGIKLSPRVTVWKSSEIEALIASLGK